MNWLRAESGVDCDVGHDGGAIIMTAMIGWVRGGRSLSLHGTSQVRPLLASPTANTGPQPNTKLMNMRKGRVEFCLMSFIPVLSPSPYILIVCCFVVSGRLKMKRNIARKFMRRCRTMSCEDWDYCHAASKGWEVESMKWKKIIWLVCIILYFVNLGTIGIVLLLSWDSTREINLTPLTSTLDTTATTTAGNLRIHPTTEYEISLNIPSYHILCSDSLFTSPDCELDDVAAAQQVQTNPPSREVLHKSLVI